jgi:hypothetical protein
MTDVQEVEDAVGETTVRPAARRRWTTATAAALVSIERS